MKKFNKASANDFTVFMDEADAERWLNSKTAFFKESRALVSAGNEYILINAKGLYQEYLEKNNISDNAEVICNISDFFTPNSKKIFGSFGVGAGIGAAAAMIFSGPIGWFAGAGALIGMGASKIDELGEVKKILVNNSKIVAETYVNHINSILAKQAEDHEKARAKNFEQPKTSTTYENHYKKTYIKEKLVGVFKKYGFEGFLHTTELENFRLIVKSKKLKSRTELESNGTIFNDRANQEVIDYTNEHIKNNCRFYYYFKTPTNFRANYSRPVIMVFDESIIFSDKTMFFYNGNAASKRSSYTSDAAEALNYDWEGIFERGAINLSKNYNAYDSDSPSKITTARNAEFLCESPILISNIKIVYFKDLKDLNEAKAFCPEELCKKFKYDRSKFN